MNISAKICSKQFEMKLQVHSIVYIWHFSLNAQIFIQLNASDLMFFDNNAYFQMKFDIRFFCYNKEQFTRKEDRMLSLNLIPSKLYSSVL